MAQHYYLFKYAKDHFRMEKATNVNEAFKMAFGSDYTSYSTVVYKDVGTRSPNYIPQKIKQEWYSDGGWRNSQGKLVTEE